MVLKGAKTTPSVPDSATFSAATQKLHFVTLWTAKQRIPFRNLDIKAAIIDD